MQYLIYFICLCTVSCAQVNFEHIETVNVPGRGNAEIISFDPEKGILLATNAQKRAIDIYRVSIGSKISLRYQRSVSVSPGGKDYEPTSVAIHPRLDFGLATVLAEERSKEGFLLGIDLRKATAGRIILRTNTGIGPDSIAISPDGKWAIIANEAQSDSTTPGSLLAVDLHIPGTAKIGSGQRYKIVQGLSHAVGTPIGDCEPEFVAFDPKGRIAAVSCQENDCVAIINMRSRPLRVDAVVRLEKASEPDGIALFDVQLEGYENMALLLVAEEGRKLGGGKYSGQAFSVNMIDTDRPELGGLLMSRIKISEAIEGLPVRCDPEGAAMARLAGNVFGFITLERADRVLCCNLNDPSSPQLIGSVKTGSRPEGVICHTVKTEKADILLVFTANEADNKPGSITLCRVVQ